MKKGVLFWVLSVIVAATVCSHCSLALTQDGKPNPQFISFAHFGLKLSSFSSADDDKLSCSSHSCILLSWVFDFDVLHIKIVSLLCLDILFWVFFQVSNLGFCILLLLLDHLMMYLFAPGLILLEMKSVLNDSRNMLSNWQDSDESPCNWTGISCHPQDQRVSAMYVKPIFYFLTFKFYSDSLILKDYVLGSFQ